MDRQHYLLPLWNQAIIGTNAGILSITPSATNFNKILMKIQLFPFKKMHLKMLSAKWHPFCIRLNVSQWNDISFALTHHYLFTVVEFICFKGYDQVHQHFRIMSACSPAFRNSISMFISTSEFCMFFRITKFWVSLVPPKRGQNISGPHFTDNFCNFTLFQISMTAVMTCIKVCSNIITSNGIAVKQILHQFFNQDGIDVSESEMVVRKPSIIHNGLMDNRGTTYTVSWLNEAETRWPPFSRRHFPMHFLEWKYINFDYDFTEVCSQGSKLQYSSIGSDNGLALARWQAIIWTNGD